MDHRFGFLVVDVQNLHPLYNFLSDFAKLVEETREDGWRPPTAILRPTAVLGLTARLSASHQARDLPH